MAQVEAGGALSHLNHEIVASLDDFQDPSQEWRRLFSELFGTFFLVLVAAGGGMMGQAFPGTISRAAAVVAPGLMVMAIILFMGKVSGAHLNPAVSVAFSLRGDFPWRRVPGYVVAQLIGATLAALFLHAVINVSASYGANYPASGYSASDAFLMEAVLTLGLVSVRRPEHRNPRRDRRRRVHCARWVVGEPDFGSVDEPRAHIRPRPRRNRLHELLGVCRGPTRGCSSRSGCSMGAPRCRRRPRRLRCGTGNPFHGSRAPGQAVRAQAQS